MQNDEAGCLPLINSWITIWQSLIINLRTAHCAAPLCSPLAKSKLASRTTGKDIRLRALYSVRHSPQFMEAFHSFGLECFIYSANIWTCALLAWISHCRVCSIVGSCCPAAALALVLNCSSSLSHWPGNTPTYQKCFVTRPAGASLLWLNHWSRLQPVGHTFNHLSCCSLFKPVNNIECKNAIHRKKHNWRNFEISQKIVLLNA